MSGTSLQTGTTPSSTQSSPLSGGAIPQASSTPSSTTTTTLPTDRLDALDQALSQLRASQADHDKPLVKQASNTSSLSNCIDHLDQKKKNDSALAALKDSISQLQDLLKAQLADNRWKDNSRSSGSSSSSSNKEEEEEEKEKRKPMLNLTAHHQDLQRYTAKHNAGDSLGDVWLMQSLLTAETLPTFHGKPSEDPNIFLTSFDCYATAAGWSHQDYILHFEGQLHDNADIIHHFLEQE